VMRAGGIKQLDALESIMELISMGAEPAKVSVLFNFAPYTVGLPNLRATLRAQFGGVFDAADKAGFHVCETPIMAADAMYKTVFGSKKWNIDALASGQDFRLQMKELRKAGQPVPDFPGRQDGPGAGGQTGNAVMEPLTEWLEELKALHQTAHGRALTTRHDQALQSCQVGRQPHFSHHSATALEQEHVLTYVTLEGQDADCRGCHVSVREVRFPGRRAVLPGAGWKHRRLPSAHPDPR